MPAVPVGQVDKRRDGQRVANTLQQLALDRDLPELNPDDGNDQHSGDEVPPPGALIKSLRALANLVDGHAVLLAWLLVPQPLDIQISFIHGQCPCDGTCAPAPA